MDLISVIVPVYNVEKYLRKCVDSIVAQTYTNLEIILVDDGSPDNCGKICDEYAEKDSRIKVIHQKNGGLSAARNAGLDIATGDYIGFVDSDDYIDKNYFECMSSHLSKNTLIVCNVIDEDENGKVIKKKEADDRRYSSAEALSEMCHEKKFGTSACGKIITKEIADKFRFPEGKLYEDLATVYKWYANCKTTILGSGTAYHYVKHFGSISQNNWNDKTRDLMEAAEEMLNYISANFPECYLDGVYRYFFSANDFITKAYRSDDYKSIFAPYQNKLKPLWKDVIKNKLSLKDFVKFTLLAFCPPLHKKLYTLKNLKK